MHKHSLAAVTLVLFAAGCGAVVNDADASAEAIDASGVNDGNASVDAAVPDAAASDAAAVECTHVPSTSTSEDVLTYTFSGGDFQSFGCGPIDPTYWLAGSGMSVTVTFVAPQARPSIRVWGMNTDDTASVAVNGAAYPLTDTSASYNMKVVCGISPGPDGVAFDDGSLTGANTPGEGNYSYQDVTLNTTGVTSIEVEGLTGAGWGFAGVSVGCDP